MDVVNMRMCVNESVVNMFVFVTFGQVQPYADGHQGGHCGPTRKLFLLWRNERHGVRCQNSRRFSR
jgi:hypothetical protein